MYSRFSLRYTQLVEVRAGLGAAETGLYSGGTLVSSDIELCCPRVWLT